MNSLQIDARSAAQGFPESRLPEFTVEDSAMIQGSTDFLGINYYTSEIVNDQEFDTSVVSYIADTGAGTSKNPNWYT